MILYICRDCGRWYNLALAEAFMNAFRLEPVKHTCIACRSDLVQVRPEDRLYIRQQEVESDVAQIE